MPKIRSVSDIKSKLLRPALTSHFEVQLSFPQALRSFLGVEQDTINLSCSEASLPGSQLTTLENNNDRTGVTEKHAYRRQFDDRIDLTFYVDGADEADASKQLLKGGGGALTREKIVASVATRFVCIIDDSKLVNLLGQFPVPLEVIPMARSAVAREIVKQGGQPVLREGFFTDNGNIILDVHGLTIKPENARSLEARLNNITGVVTNGIFALRPADVLLISSTTGVTCRE